MTANPLSAVFSDDLKLSDRRIERLHRVQEGIRKSGCTRCGLAEERGTHAPVPGEGRGRILFVGHKIGGNEANSSRPAIGPASQYGFQLFVKALPGHYNLTDSKARDFVLDYAYVTNAARCGHGNDVSVTKSNWDRCAGAKGPNWLRQELLNVKPEIIVFWQKSMARAVLGQEPPALGEIKEMQVFGKTYPVMLMTHPVKVAHEPEEEPTVIGHYQQLIKWLSKNDFITANVSYAEETSADHRLVETKAELEAMIEDLWDKRWVALDTETAFHKNQGEITERERDKGALMWHADGFETVCYQICGFDEGLVKRTYTVAARFRERLTGRRQHELTADEAFAGLDRLLSHAPESGGEPVAREICMWNALFDCPVLTGEGIDVWGLSGRPYPIRIWDGMLILGRLNEHLGRRRGRSTLDNAVKMYLQERKGSFADHFTVEDFPFERLSDPETRAHLLDYTGNDPRKTLLVLMELFNHLADHIKEVQTNTTQRETSLPTMGFAPFPKPAETYTQSRIRDVAIPLDHQMVPLIGEMEMIGFKLDRDKVRRANAYVKKTMRRLKHLIHEMYAWYNPNSGDDAKRVMRKSFTEVAAIMNRMITEGAPKSDVLEAFQLDERQVTGQVHTDHFIEAFERGYGDFDAQRKTIKNRYLIYFEASLNLLLEVARKHEIRIDVPQDADPERLTTFFNRVFIYKQLDKKWGTYFERFMDLAGRDDIIHARYNLIATLSGRFSGNFQNVPRGGEEDLEFIEDLLEAMGETLPEDNEARQKLLQKHNKLDVRQSCSVLQAEDLNMLFEHMNLASNVDGERVPWRVRDEDYVLVSADFAAQEDRMAFALTGDETKARLLENPDIDTHFYNVAFCFGGQHGYDTSTEEGVMAAYNHFTANKAEYKSKYRTPMKNVHYASTYGAAAPKLHTLIAPIFMKLGVNWSLSDTEELKEKYDVLYAGVTEAREDLLDDLERHPYLEYPVYGTLRHAKQDFRGDIVQSEYLSSANAYNQGTSAYITKTAMLRMRHLIEANKERWNLVHAGGDRYVGLNIQVHDEIGIICPASLAPEVALALESAMKIIVEPGRGKAYWNDTVADARGETGWLVLPDEQFYGQVLFDADAEIKRTVAKSKKLSDGRRNILALLDKPETVAAYKEEYPLEVNEDYPLVLTRKGHIDRVI